jgi:hypothetical protein
MRLHTSSLNAKTALALTKLGALHALMGRLESEFDAAMQPSFCYCSGIILGERIRTCSRRCVIGDEVRFWIPDLQKI